MEYFVDEARSGRTVLEVLKKELGLSSALIRHLKFSEGGITVDGAHVTVRHLLREGELLRLALEDEEAHEKVTPVDLPLEIAYEDEHTVLPCKPFDMPTHPSHGHWEDTVANALAFRYAEMGIPFIFRPVNRLDRNTSGLLLIARDRMTAGKLFLAMKDGRIRKLYFALLQGELPEEEGVITTYMRRTAESIILRENCGEGEGGDLAVTKYRRLASRDGITLVAAAPITGRTHQLRVHFAGLGAPLLGDDLYGSPSELISRHALHSGLLSFPRDGDRETVTVTSPLPEDMAAVARQLFGRDDFRLSEHFDLTERDRSPI